MYVMYIVLETFGGPAFAGVCTTPDGENCVFDTAEDANGYAKENCQAGMVIPINEPDVSTR